MFQNRCPQINKVVLIQTSPSTYKTQTCRKIVTKSHVFSNR